MRTLTQDQGHRFRRTRLASWKYAQVTRQKLQGPVSRPDSMGLRKRGKNSGGPLFLAANRAVGKENGTLERMTYLASLYSTGKQEMLTELYRNQNNEWPSLWVLQVAFFTADQFLFEELSTVSFPNILSSYSSNSLGEKQIVLFHINYRKKVKFWCCNSNCMHTTSIQQTLTVFTFSFQVWKHQVKVINHAGPLFCF